MSVKPTMLLVTSLWQEKKSFRLMPISVECPFSEGIYDPDSKVLVVMSITTKESVHMLPKLDDNGDPTKAKGPRPNGKLYREHRVTLDTYNEHYIMEKAEIENFINMFAINAKDFNYGTYMSGIVTPDVSNIQIVSK